MVVLLFGAATMAQPSLNITGTCPGLVDVEVVGVTPGGTVAAIHGDAPGADAIPVGAPACGGTLTGLSGVKLFKLLDDADYDGEHHLGPTAPAPQCGRFVQLVDLSSCATSNVVQLRTGTCEASGRMALIPGGRFQMGSPAGEVGRESDETQHWVTLTHSYCIAKTELTGAEYAAIVGPPGAGTDHPLTGISWHDAARFANAVSAMRGLNACYSCSWELIDAGWFYYYGWVCDSDGNPYECEGYRLATEAEWERAARGGLVGASFPNGGNLYPGDEGNCNGNLELDDGSALDDVTWYCGNNVPDQAKEVALLLPNAYGLFDMGGNAAEWCHDVDAPYGGDAVDPHGPSAGPSPSRVVRMGAWRNPPSSTRVANREAAEPHLTFQDVGIRLARSNP